MEDKDYIKELFSEKLTNHTTKVNPKVWSAVKSSLTTTSAVSIALTTKVIIGVSATIAIVGGVYLFSKSEREIQAVKVEQNSISKQKSTPELILNETTTQTPPKKELETREISYKEIDTNSAVGITENIAVREEYVDSNLHSNEKKQNLPTETPITEQKTGNVLNRVSEVSEKETISEFSILSSKEGGVYLFKLDFDEFDFIEWNFGDGNYSTEREASHVYNSSGKYLVQVKVIKGNTYKTRTIEVGKEAVGKISKWPSVVTFNNDGFNDALVLETENLKDFQITILSRSNEVVFKSSNTDFMWSGLDLKGEPVKAGNYVYFITATDIAGNPINEYQMLEVKR